VASKVVAQAPRRPIQGSRLHLPLRFIFVNLVSGISPSLLNCFLWFQWCCYLLENIFPTTHNTTQYVQGIPRKNM